MLSQVTIPGISVSLNSYISADAVQLHQGKRDQSLSLCVKESLPSPLPFRLAKYLFPVVLETVQERLAL